MNASDARGGSLCLCSPSKNWKGKCAMPKKKERDEMKKATNLVSLLLQGDADDGLSIAGVQKSKTNCSAELTTAIPFCLNFVNFFLTFEEIRFQRPAARTVLTPSKKARSERERASIAFSSPSGAKGLVGWLRLSLLKPTVLRVWWRLREK